jgi:hypothetical protein
MTLTFRGDPACFRDVVSFFASLQPNYPQITQITANEEKKSKSGQANRGDELDEEAQVWSQ